MKHDEPTVKPAPKRFLPHDRAAIIINLINPETTDVNRAIEYPGYDGWYNNLGHPEFGAIDTPLLRRWPAAYEDGVYKPSGSNRPEPLELSDKLLKGTIGSKSRTGKNALMVFFGKIFK